MAIDKENINRKQKGMIFFRFRGGIFWYPQINHFISPNCLPKINRHGPPNKLFCTPKSNDTPKFKKVD